MDEWKGGPVNDRSLLRHFALCRNVTLPGERPAFRIGTHTVGWIMPELAASLSRFAGVTAGARWVMLDDPSSLPGIARTLADRGMFRWRDEAFDVRAEPEGRPLARIDRGALPLFGIAALGVHVNGLVRRSDGVWLWVARRAADKRLDPGKLDNIVAGGVPAGLTVAETLLKEAAEEAAIPPELAARAEPVAQIDYAMQRPEGLRRDRLHCYDLWLPDGFAPRPNDGEVESFELWPVARALDAVRQTDAFKFNVNLVLIDLFCRLGLLADP